MTQNSQRIRPTQSFSLPRYQLEFISEAALLTGRKKSAILQDLIDFYLDRSEGNPNVPVRRVSELREEGSSM